MMQQFASTMAPNLPPPLISIQVICLHSVNCTSSLPHFGLGRWHGPLYFLLLAQYSEFLVIWILTHLRIWEQPARRSSTTRPSLASSPLSTLGSRWGRGSASPETIQRKTEHKRWIVCWAEEAFPGLKHFCHSGWMINWRDQPLRGCNSPTFWVQPLPLKFVIDMGLLAIGSGLSQIVHYCSVCCCFVQ